MGYGGSHKMLLAPLTSLAVTENKHSYDATMARSLVKPISLTPLQTRGTVNYNYSEWRREEEDLIMKRLTAMDRATELRLTKGVSPLVSCQLDDKTLRGAISLVTAGETVHVGLTVEYNFGGGITAGDNILKMWCDNCGGFSCPVTGPENSEATIQYLGKGTYSFSYMPTITGTYSVDLRLGGKSVPGAPLKCTVEPGPTDVLQCSASGMGLLCGEAGAEGLFQIQARDRFGNRRTVGGDPFSVNFAGPMSFSPTVVDNNDGTYSIRYTTIMCGSYTVSINLDGKPLPGSPFLLSAIAGRAYGPSCQAEGSGLQGCVAGEEAMFMIGAKDIVGNKKIIGGDPFVVDMEGPSGPRVSVLDRDDGTYEVTYMAPVCGVYTIKCSLFDMPIMNSPFLVEVQPGVIKAMMCTAHGNGVTGFQIGDKISLTVEARDALRNRRKVGGDQFDTSIRGPLCPPVMLDDKGNGEYVGRYNTVKAGVYFVTISLAGVDILGSPFKVFAEPGNTHAIGCTCSGAGTSGGFVGVEASFEIQARDKEGNNRTSGGDVFSVELSGTASPVATVRDMQNGVYLVTYTPPVGGDYYISVKHNGMDLPSTPFLISVDPLPKETYLQLYRSTQPGPAADMESAIKQTYLESDSAKPSVPSSLPSGAVGDQQWQLTVKLLGGKDLAPRHTLVPRAKAGASAGPHVRFTVGSVHVRSKETNNLQKPLWNQEVQLPIVDRLDKLLIGVFNSALTLEAETAETSYGDAEISLLDLVEGKPKVVRASLLNTASGELQMLLTLKQKRV